MPTPREVNRGRDISRMNTLLNRWTVVYHDDNPSREASSALEDSIISGSDDFLAAYDRYCEGR